MVDAVGLKQLYSREREFPDEFGWIVLYEVRAIVKDGADIKLVGRLATQAQAIFIEHKIEQYLQIKSAPVPGEIPIRKG